MPTLEQHIAARRDADLLERITAAAEAANIPNAQQWAVANIGHVVSVEITGGTTIADVHAFAVASYNPGPRPGQDPAIITDSQVIEAVTLAQ